LRASLAELQHEVAPRSAGASKKSKRSTSGSRKIQGS
jgi:hypothetical protein